MVRAGLMCGTRNMALLLTHPARRKWTAKYAEVPAIAIACAIIAHV
jgi:hypothetical protein